MNLISRVKNAGRRWPGRAVAVAAAAVLTACGGGSDGLSCSVADEKVWLRDYMDDWYFWYAYSPSPDPSGYASVDAYFQALLYQGTNLNFPKADTWSNIVSEADFNLTYGEGRTLGYGVFVTGVEVTGRPDLPLYIRYLDPGSPGAIAGLARGDQILSVNGRPASDMISANDYSALQADGVGDSATLVVRNGTGDHTVTLSATIYDLVPVQGSQVITTPDGRKMGYVMVKDMIDQAVSPIDVAFGQFKAQGIQDVMLDLRYNGGGLVSVAEKIASFPNGPATSGQVFASLLYNDKRAGANNESFHFHSYANAAGLARVYVLTGPRTCSSSESVINGLRPFVEVVTVGDTTCGKPVGTLPTPDGCGAVVNAINFESVNASNQGRYFDGFDATCPVAEDFGEPIGGVNDPLRIAAEDHADGFSCTTVAANARRGGDRVAVQGVGGKTTKVLGLVPGSQRVQAAREPGERGGMLGR
jgi:carboxyl-terminal processing protease